MPFQFNTDKKEVKMSLKDVTVLLDKLRLPISLVFTPTNLEQEKAKFFDSDSYEPVFRYRKIANTNAEILKKLVSIDEIIDVDPRISEFYLELIQAKKNTNDLMNNVGNNEMITKLSTEKYGMPTPMLFRNATRILKGKVENYKTLNEDFVKNQKYLNYNEIKSAFDITFEMLGLDGWKAEKSQNIAKNGAKLGVKNQRVFLYGDIKKRPYELRKTIIHEVGTHALRAVNGARCGFPAFAKANVPSYLLAEEGLAMYNEESMGVLTKKDLRNRAAMVWAIYVGSSMSFRQLYNCLLALFPKKQAFDLTYRVKRGLGDTAKPGIYSKDIVYLRGFLKIRRQIASEPSAYKMLYAGKIGLDKIIWVEEGVLNKAKIVPTKALFEDIFKKIGI
jgi:hypothetical protein